MSTARVIREILTNVIFLINFEIEIVVVDTLFRHLELLYCLQVSMQISENPDFRQIVLSRSKNFDGFCKEPFVFEHPEE